MLLAGIQYRYADSTLIQAACLVTARKCWGHRILWRCQQSGGCSLGPSHGQVTSLGSQHMLYFKYQRMSLLPACSVHVGEQLLRPSALLSPSQWAVCGCTPASAGGTARRLRVERGSPGSARACACPPVQDPITFQPRAGGWAGGEGTQWLSTAPRCCSACPLLLEAVAAAWARTHCNSGSSSTQQGAASDPVRDARVKVVMMASATTQPLALALARPTCVESGRVKQGWRQAQRPAGGRRACRVKCIRNMCSHICRKNGYPVQHRAPGRVNAAACRKCGACYYRHLC